MNAHGSDLMPWMKLDTRRRGGAVISRSGSRMGITGLAQRMISSTAVSAYRSKSVAQRCRPALPLARVIAKGLQPVGDGVACRLVAGRDE